MSGPLLFGTNWKMHKTTAEAGEYAQRLVQRLELLESPLPTVFVIPPFTAIEAVRRFSAGRFLVGAQNMHWADWGPYTGEISAPMLRELDVELVELGHAERRELYNETDADVNRKVHTALRFGLRPLVCIGEEAEDKSFGAECETVARQLRIALHGVPGESASRLMIAYEPCWAIGDGGATADPEYIREILSVMRGILGVLLGSAPACSVPILYGGSVSPTEAPDLLHKSGVDGLFVGRSALDADDFADLIANCVRAKPYSP
ncbi:MAG: triose-phosphate isomerase family protein [Methanoregula sp.]